jgi:hypothetical protein
LSIIRGFLHKQKLSKKTNEISILERRELWKKIFALQNHCD